MHFEPWNFTDTNQLLTQFFVRLANEFQKKGDENLTKIGKALESYSDAFGLLELIPVVGTPIAAASKWGLSLLGKKMQKGLDDRDVLKQKDQVVQLLKDQANRILVVLDDIDRLSNEQIRYIFQLITSVARFPNTTYLLVFDKEIVVGALKEVQSGNGEDYLEKVIQMPIQIPDIKRSDLRNVLFDRLESIKNDFHELGFVQNHWQRLFETCVDPFIKHLRDINRLTNALRFKLTNISSEVDLADMIAISVFEIHHPLIFEWIKNNKSILTGDHDFSSSGNNRSHKEWLEHYKGVLRELYSQERPESIDEEELDQVIKSLAELFPHFGQRIGIVFEACDFAKFGRNNQIAHPDKYERYFHLNIDDIPYRTAEVRDLIHRLSENEIIDFLMTHEQSATSYELLEDIKARIVELTGERAKVLAKALLRAMVNLKQTIHRSLFSMSTGIYAEHLILDIVDRIPDTERMSYISDLIMYSDMDTLQSVATIINMIELGYGRLAANGQERNYNKVITLEELCEVETLFAGRIKEILKERSLFDFSEWRMVYHLLNSFDPEYTHDYLQEAFKDNKNVLWFLGQYITIWTGGGKAYEVQMGYTDHFTSEQVLSAIEVCRQNGELFKLPEELQHKCVAFFLDASGISQYRDSIYQDDVDRLLTTWKA